MRYRLIALMLLASMAACSDDSNPVAPDVCTGPCGCGATPCDAGPAVERGGDSARVDLRRDRTRVDSAPEAQFCGKLVDSAGAPVPKGDIIICNEVTCYNGTADSGGAFCVGADAVADYVFHAVEKTVGGKHVADVFFPLSLNASEIASRKRIELGTITQPLLASTSTLADTSATCLTLGTGSKLCVSANSLVLPALKSPPLEVGLAEVPVAKIHPRLLALRSGTPVRAYALVPHDISFSPAATLEITTSGSGSVCVPSTPPDCSLDAFHVSEKTGKLEAVGQATVTAGLLSKGVPALGWWLFYNKP